MMLQLFAAGAAVVKVILAVGYGRKTGESDDAVKVDLKSFDGRVGLDIRDWYKPSQKWMDSRATDPERQKAWDDNHDAKDRMPGKGIFLPLAMVPWLHEKLTKLIESKEYKEQVKLMEDAAKKAATSPEPTEADKKLAKENADLAKKNADLEARLAKLEAALTSKTDKPAETPAEKAADTELEEIVPARAAVPTNRGKGGSRR